MTENIPHGNVFKIYAYFFTNILLSNLCKNVYPHNREISSEQLTLEWGSKILQGPNSGLADNVPKSRCSSHRESKGPIYDLWNLFWKEIPKVRKIANYSKDR